jgi:hypothetical protein
MIRALFSLERGGVLSAPSCAKFLTCAENYAIPSK